MSFPEWEDRNYIVRTDQAEELLGKVLIKCAQEIIDNGPIVNDIREFAEQHNVPLNFDLLKQVLKQQLSASSSTDDYDSSYASSYY